MGYYSGNGIVSGGASVPGSAGSFTLPRSRIRGVVKNLTNTTTTKFPGVSLATAQEQSGVNNMATKGVWEQYGSYFYDVIFPLVSGNQTGFTYSQIGDSNLYELVKTYTAVTTSVDTNITSLV